MENKVRSAPIGLENVVVALMTQEDTATSEPVYAEPQWVAQGVSATITTNSVSEKAIGDNGTAEEVALTTGGELSLKIHSLPVEIASLILGQKINNDGVLVTSGDDRPPYVAIGFKSMKGNGKYRYVWVHKVKFQVPEESYESIGDGTVTFQQPELTGSIANLKCGTKDMKYLMDEDGINYNKEVAANWFNAPYNPNAATPTMYTVKATCGANGTIDPIGDIKVLSGNSKAFAFMPAAGYSIDKVTVDEVDEASPGTSYVFENVTQDHTLNVTFKTTV